MASILYVVLCGILAAFATHELRGRNRRAHIQTYMTLLGALAFCGMFALLVTAARQFQTLATAGVLLLTAGSLYALAHAGRRFRAMPAALKTRRPHAR